MIINLRPGYFDALGNMKLILNLSTLVENSPNDIVDDSFSYFTQTISIDIICKVSP